jgi:hypothetical protein
MVQPRRTLTLKRHSNLAWLEGQLLSATHTASAGSMAISGSSVQHPPQSRTARCDILCLG